MEMKFQELVEKHGVQIYDKYIVTMQTANKFLGGWPKDPEVELAMLEARFRRGLVKEETVEEARKKVADASSADPEEETEKANLKSWTSFKSNDRGIYIESRQIKAGFKEVSTTMGLTNALRGVKQVLQHLFFIRGTEDPDIIYLYRDGEPIKEPEGYEQMIAHVIGPQGPRSTIKFHDLVEPGTQIQFEIWFNDPKRRVDEEYLTHCLVLAQDNGFGCSRSQGFGRVEVLTVERIATGELLGQKKAKAEAADKKAKADAAKAKKETKAAASKAKKGNGK